MKDYRIDDIRNVVLLSHGGAGKTSLAEAMLFDAGSINRLGRVDDGTTTSDYDPEEVRRKISITMSLLQMEWKNNKVNIIDTPGYADFVGEVKAAAAVVEGALVVVSAVAGLEVGTELVWKYADESMLSRFIFINKMDRENADFFKSVDQVRARFGSGCCPIQLPIGSQHEFRGIVDLIKMKAYMGDKAPASEIPASMTDQANEWREKLLESVAETDDVLIAKYLDGEQLTEAEIESGLRAGTKSGKIVPILTGSALQNMSIPPLLDSVCHYLPSPKDVGVVKAAAPTRGAEVSLTPEESGPLAALSFKTTADPYVGKLTYLRVYSGVLNSDSHVWNASNNKGERIGQLFSLRGKNQEPITRVIAGDIGAVAKLAETSTGDTLCQKEHPVLLPPVQFPRPSYSVAVMPKTKADLDKLGTSLTRLTEEDPTLNVHRDPDTAEIILTGIGDSHIEVTAEKMHRKFGVEVKLETPKVPYKETITVHTRTEYKHKKQTGGHGQYGHVVLELEPQPRGSGIEFAEKVVGGAVPRNYIPAVEKGVAEGTQEGVLAHYPVVDVKTTLVDGSYHPVDSSEMSFKIATIQALKKGMTQANPVLLEPIMNLRVVVPGGVMGDAIGDLNGKRARVLGTTPDDGMTVIDAQVPQSEVMRYATELRSITQGRGSYTTEFSHYEEVPAHIAQKIIAEAKKEAEKE